MPAALCWALGLLIAFYPVFFSGFRQIIADPGDDRFLNYILEYSFYWLNHGSVNYWDPPMFFPAPNTAAYSDVLLSTAPLYWCVRFLGIQPDTAFQVFLLIVSSLNFLVFYFLLRSALRLSEKSSALGAFLFAFGSPRLAQLNHAQLLLQFFVVLATFCLFKLFEAPQKRAGREIPKSLWIFAFFACCVAQLYAGFYLAWFFFLGLLIFLGFALFDRRASLQGFIRGKMIPISVATFLSLVALAPFFAHYLSAAKGVGFRDFSEVKAMLPRLQSWFYLGPENWAYGWMSRIKLWRMVPIPHEHAMGIGFVTLAFCTSGLWRNRGLFFVKCLLLSSATALLITTLFPGDWTLWKVFYLFYPGASAIRAVSRITLLLLIPASVGLALFAEGKKKGVSIFLLGALVMIEQGRLPYSYSKEKTRAVADAISAKIDPKKCGYFFYSPIYTTDDPAFSELVAILHSGKWRHYPQIDAIWAQMRTGVPTLNGYSGNFPVGWSDLEFNEILGPPDEERLGKALRNWIARNGLDPKRLCWIREVQRYEGRIDQALDTWLMKPDKSN